MLSGCLGGSNLNAQSSDSPVAPAVHRAASMLENATEDPGNLTAPVFDLLGAVAKGGPVYGAGEPSVRAAMDGTLYLSFPGCDRGFYLVHVPGEATCGNGPVYRSDDAGATWTRLNDPQTGKLSADGPNANGDADIAVDANGTVYASDLGANGIQVWRSTDRGGNWTYLGNATGGGNGTWEDRQWMAAADPGHLIVTWMGGATGNQRAVAVNVTWDGGDTWSGVTYLGHGIGWLGPVRFDPAGTRAYIPFTQLVSGPPGVAGDTGSTYELLVARTLDGGATWDVVDTGVTLPTTPTGFHWSGTLMAPSIAVLGDGEVAVVYSQESRLPGGAASDGASVKVVDSTDHGATWSAPVNVSTEHQAIFPWAVAGAEDRLVVTYFASNLSADADLLGAWDVKAALLDAPSMKEPTIVRSTVAKDVHLGGICTRGSLCAFADRDLLDFFQSALLPDGRVVVSYPSDPPQDARYIDIDVAVQSGGTLLLQPPTAAGNGTAS